MATIKDAAVPHYSKYNGKIVFAVRVCPANVSVEPFTVYRRWDEFLDFSTKLSNVFPSASPNPDDPSAIFRRIPRLSRKVTLFPTSATHSSRRDELDLFVRHLVHLPRAVTSFPLVREFFSIKPNGLDGRQPPSPGPMQTAYFDARNTAVEGMVRSPSSSSVNDEVVPAQQEGQQRQVLRKKSSKMLNLVQRPLNDVEPQAPPKQSFRPLLMGKRSTPDLRRFISPSAPSPTTSPAVSPRGGRISRSPSASSSNDGEAPYMPSLQEASLYPTLQGFSFPPREVSPQGQAVPRHGSRPNSASSSHSGSPPTSPPSSRPSTGNALGPTPTSPTYTIASLAGGSDTCSTRTSSTVRPHRGCSTTTTTYSRMASPLSFVSASEMDEGTDSGRSTPLAFPRPPVNGRNGNSKSSAGPSQPSLRHFRSLQDIRNVLAPHPHIPMLDSSCMPTYTPAGPSETSTPSASSIVSVTPPQTPGLPSPSTSTPTSRQSRSSSIQTSTIPVAAPPMVRARSDSRILLSKPLPSVTEDPSAPVSTTTITRSGSGRRTSPFGMAMTPIFAPGTSQPMAKSHSEPHHTSSTQSQNQQHVMQGLGFAAYPVRRPSLNNGMRRIQTHSASSSASSLKQHSHSPSTSSIDSLDSGSSLSLSRSQASSAGLGFEFSSSSRDSFDFSDHTTNASSSSLGSPDSSMMPCTPPTPSSASLGKTDPFDKLLAWQQSQQMQSDGVTSPTSSYPGHNVAPPLPFFPTPAAYDQLTSLSRRNSAANRRRASSLHQPVLETIIGSPVLGGAVGENGNNIAEQQPAAPTVTLKVMTETSNFLLKLAKSSSLVDVKQKVLLKAKASGLDLPFEPSALNLAVVSQAGAGSGDSTAKASKILNAKASILPGQACEQVGLDDEEDWQLALSLAAAKITLRVV